MRVTVLLPDELYEQLRREASDQGVSMAELIRCRLEAGGWKRCVTTSGDPLARVEGLVRDGHLSEGIDCSVYSHDCVS